jgi:hypothetical protein
MNETTRRGGVNFLGLLSTAIFLFLGLEGKSPSAWLARSWSPLEIPGWMLLFAAAVILATIGSLRYRRGWLYLLIPAIFPVTWIAAWVRK